MHRQPEFRADAGSQPDSARPDVQEDRDDGNDADDPEGKDSPRNHGKGGEDRAGDGETLNA